MALLNVEWQERSSDGKKRLCPPIVVSQSGEVLLNTDFVCCMSVHCSRRCSFVLRPGLTN